MAVYAAHIRRASHLYSFGILIFLCVAPGTNQAHGQISPGELSKAHASLEGTGSCTSCHELGRSVTNERCLRCHTELQARLRAGTGFHATLASHKCVECHKEHFGRDFALVRFDHSRFDHNSTGFLLEGAHGKTRCAACHNAANIRAEDVKSNPGLLQSGTFLGLSRECSSCHTDAHRGQLGTRCSSCHTADSWKPAPLFSHDRTRFPLTGRHTTVACATCHPVVPQGTTRKFKGLSFATCLSCHADPHKGKFANSCSGCHTTADWKTIAGGKFDHSRTRFPLIGKHLTTPCSECHRAPTSAGTRRSVIAKFDRCSDCHLDPHRGEFVTRPGKGECSTCHTENGFTPAAFNHGTARYPLEGKHQNVQCVRCHPTSRQAGAPRTFTVAHFDRCGTCHADGHSGQFVGRTGGGDCSVCHNVQGFLPTTYTAANHARTRIPLSGSHAAVACAQCHTSGWVRTASTRRFTWEDPKRCTSCHADPHERQFEGRPWSACTSCHTPEAWRESTFNHGQTGFRLEGKHATAACTSCHPPEKRFGTRLVFSGKARTCVDCHGDSQSRSGNSARRQ